MLIYAIYKVQLLIDKDESRVQKTLEEQYYDQDDSFSSTMQGFNVAFAISSYADSAKSIYQDESYGRLRLIY